MNHFRDKIPVGGIIPYYVGMLASLSKPLTQEYKIQIDDKKYPNDKYTFVVFVMENIMVVDINHVQML